MKKIAKIVLPVIFGMSFLTGCGAQGNDAGVNNHLSQTDTGYGDGHLIPSGSVYVKKISINDTDCVIYKDGDAGGVDCDWGTNAAR